MQNASEHHASSIFSPLVSSHDRNRGVLCGRTFAQLALLVVCTGILPQTTQEGIQLSRTKMTLSPLRNILLMNLSLLTPLAFPLPFSVHISFTFSRTMLQWRSKALTRASSLRLFRHEIRTWVCVRVAVMRMERGPVESSCASRTETSYSLLR